MKDQLAAIKAAVAAIEQAERVRLSEDRNKVLYIIWESSPHDRIADHSEVAGTFYGTYTQADELLQRLNEAGKEDRRSYYRTEPTAITPQNEHEFTTT